MAEIDISGLSKAAVLAAMYNATAPAGIGFLQAGGGPMVMTEEDAEALIDTGSPDPGASHGLFFDYLYGRPLKLNLSGDSFDPYPFDRDNGGPGTAQKIIDKLRQTGEVNDFEKQQAAEALALARADDAMVMASTPITEEDPGFISMGGADIGADIVHAVDREMARRTGK